MIKYILDNVAKGSSETELHVVYVKVYDDKNMSAVLTSLCIPYITKEQFEAELELKTKKDLADIAGKDSIKTIVLSSLTAVENKLKG